ncbi:hypothetical protein SAMN04488515_1884 [Cognatiyoonia koreensis]|uniref:Uncharacterized protein n=1 Tax=Cognatiyoonia koreensis TaxID=364200 RepID=A0A1I0QFX2_9RHOB|nr:hypothetical protein [Cognatiyoonia koreensis]SEW25860.1 hypothetical protein SAMN04488515_1884 [Cognatiyoonia koreensis]
MQDNHPKAAENYTDAFLWSFGLLLFMVFFVMTAFVGIIWALITALTLNRGMTFWVRRRDR